MTHALTIRTDVEVVPYHADPIFVAIDRNSEAWSVFQVTPEGDASIAADAEIFGHRAFVRRPRRRALKVESAAHGTRWGIGRPVVDRKAVQ